MRPDDTQLGTNKEPGRIAGMFDDIAHRYDLLNHLLSAGLDVRWRAQAIRSLDLRGGETVLDLCTGTGDLAIAACAGDRAAARVVGIDFSAQMLRIGAEKLARQGRSTRIRLIRGDAMRIPLASASVDAVTVAFGIRNVERPDETFADAVRVLRPGGRVAILEFGLPRAPLLRRAYLAYFRHALPLIGRAISGHSTAYTYLPASVATFPEPGRLLESLGAAGFEAARAVPLALGVVYLYSARKPPGV